MIADIYIHLPTFNIFMRVSSTLISHWQFCAMFRNADANKRRKICWIMNLYTFHLILKSQLSAESQHFLHF